MNPSLQPATPTASPLRSDTQFSDAVPGALKGLVDRYGRGLLDDAGRLRGLLADEVPQARKEISVLLLALDEQVPQDLLRVHVGEPISSLSPRLVRRLADEKSLSPEAARWAVHAWALGLGVDSVVYSQPFAGAGRDGLAQEGVPAAFGHTSAANQATAGAASAVSRPAAFDLADRRTRLGGIVAAAVALAGAAWWFTVPKLEIAQVETAGLFVGNGKPVPVLVAYEARNTQVKSAELRLVSGEGAWAQKQWAVDVSPDASQPGRVAAGTLQVSTARPLQATFEVVLVGSDGKRSSPFRRTFDVVPPLVITRVNVPRGLVVGREQVLEIAYQKGGADVVRLERRVVDSSTPWNPPQQAQPVQPAPGSNTLAYRLEAFDRPTRATLEFALVDAAGQRSEPVRVALNVGLPQPATPGTGPGEVVAVRQVGSASSNDWSTTIGTAAGAVVGFLTGRQVGKGNGRTAATVIGTAGGAWAGYEVGKRMGGDPNAVHETTVRMDDGHTRVITTRGTPPWAPGSRVVWDGRTLSPGTAR